MEDAASDGQLNFLRWGNGLLSAVLLPGHTLGVEGIREGVLAST